MERLGDSCRDRVHNERSLHRVRIRVIPPKLRLINTCRLPQILQCNKNSAVDVVKVMTVSQFAEDARRVAASKNNMGDPNPCSNTHSVGWMDYPSPSAFNEVTPDDLNVISAIP